MRSSFSHHGHLPRARHRVLTLLVASLAWMPVGTQLQMAQAQSTAPSGATASGTLPTLGDGTDMTVAAERRLGDRIAASIYRDADNLDDAELGDYVQSLWQPLRAAARARGELTAEIDERFAWEIFLVRDRSVNAFALPGGYFGVNLGLIATVGTPDEMAAVMAHELSHVTQRHIARLITQQNRQAPWMLAAMILGALAAGKNANVANAAIVGGQAVAAQGQLNFSRDMEREADRVGYGVMTGAGFDSRGVTGMFDKLQQASRLNDNGAFPYLRSHPLTTERIAEAQSRLQLENRPANSAAGANPANPASPANLANAPFSQTLHAMMSARARALAANGVDGWRPLVAEAERRAAAPGPVGMVISAATSRDAGTLYGGALAAAKLGDYQVARALLGKLTPLAAGDERTRQAATLLGMEIDLQAGTVSAAVSGFDLGGAASRAELFMYSRAWLAAKRPQPVQSVIDRLQLWVAAHPRDAQAWQLLSQAYTSQKQDVRAIRADAESRVAQFEYSGALDRMKAAQNMIRNKTASADYVENSIIDTRTRQIEALLKEQLLQEKVDR